ncbi:ARM repeat-containing protein [Rhizoclosmatium globosum]|uniref:ARM repeat-containing protein n=1 Tax=Rhizoclosmatium globosum TaxID=329046 RepID=A0A1Y2AQL0_9FUNG|nr:ARM repeat-containing protein [Rhizoclosmatium globosum]|eukprot:ORY24853.1 ARM repeat-containing protein [Rhizoclosmatium globosum]
MSTVPPLTADEILATDASLQRDANVLTSSQSDRLAKKRAAESIAKQSKSAHLNARQTSKLFEQIGPFLFVSLSDPIEKVRELAAIQIKWFVEGSSDIVPVLPSLLPTLSSRLSPADLQEPSEEVRHHLVALLRALILATKQVFGPGVDESLRILGRTLNDPFPDVKKESCLAVVALCEFCPREVQPSIVAFVKELGGCLTHRHKDVRAHALKALAALCLVEAQALDEVKELLRALTLDKTPSVRESLYLHLALSILLKHPDRWSLGHKVYWILLAGTVDEDPSVRKKCISALDQVGALYEVEWEDRVKNEIDVDVGRGGVLLSDRPRIGIRHFTRETLDKTIQVILADLGDWSVDTRAQAARVLGAVVPLAEANISGYMDKLLPVLYRVLGGDDASVTKGLKVAVVGVGRYVDPKIAVSLVVGHARVNPDSSATHLTGVLRVLAGLVKGAVGVGETEREVVARFLAAGDVSLTESVVLGVEVSEVLKVVAEKVGGVGGDGDGEDGYLLFVVAMRLVSVKGGDKVAGWTQMVGNAEDALRSLAEGGNVYERYFDKFWSNEIAKNVASWTRFSTLEVRILDTFLKRAGAAVGAKLKEVVDVFAVGVSVEKEFEVRQSLLTTFLDLIKPSASPLNSTNELSSHAAKIIDGIVMPSAIWKPGRKLGLLRGLGMSILVSLLDPTATTQKNEFLGYVPKAVVDSLVETEGGQYLPVTVACLDEEEVETRLTAVKALKFLLDGGADAGVSFIAQNFKTVYPDLIKRLDDASDSVRVAASGGIVSLANAIQFWYTQHPAEQDGQNGMLVDGVYVETRLDSVHWVEMIKGIVIHVDDANSEVAEAASAALVAVCRGGAPREVVVEQLDLARKRFRNVGKLDTVVSAVL